jgi:hypothetical protein
MAPEFLEKKDSFLWTGSVCLSVGLGGFCVRLGYWGAVRSRLHLSCTVNILFLHSRKHRGSFAQRDQHDGQST